MPCSLTSRYCFEICYICAIKSYLDKTPKNVYFYMTLSPTVCIFCCSKLAFETIIRKSHGEKSWGKNVIMKWGKSAVNWRKHILGLMVIFNDIKRLFKNNLGFINNNEHVFFSTFIAFTRFRHRYFSCGGMLYF